LVCQLPAFDLLGNAALSAAAPAMVAVSVTYYDYDYYYCGLASFRTVAWRRTDFLRAPNIAELLLMVLRQPCAAAVVASNDVGRKQLSRPIANQPACELPPDRRNSS